jgi:hypothetical protein
MCVIWETELSAHLHSAVLSAVDNDEKATTSMVNLKDTAQASPKIGLIKQSQCNAYQCHDPIGDRTDATSRPLAITALN